jgi:hypothetical protein
MPVVETVIYRTEQNSVSSSATYPNFVFKKCNKLFSRFFNVQESVLRESMSIIVQQDATIYSLLYFCKLLYMFRVATPPVIRSTYNCNYSIWRWSNFGKRSV